MSFYSWLSRRAVGLEPDNAGTLDTLAEVLFRMGRKQDALDTIEKAIALEPDDDYLKGQRDRFHEE